MKWFAAIIIFLLFGANILAQGKAIEGEQNKPPRFLISASFQLMKPLADFDRSVQTYGYGFGGEVLVRLNQSIPVYIGIDLSGVRYDRETINFLTEQDGQLIELEEETAPGIFLGHGVIRIEPPVNFFAYPYFEGLIGFKNFVTRTKIRDIELDEDAILSNAVEEGDWAFSYGASAGLSIPLGNGFATIDMKCTYLLGHAADFMVRRNDISGTPNRPIDLFEVKNSTTDLLLPQIGLTFAFGN